MQKGPRPTRTRASRGATWVRSAAYAAEPHGPPPPPKQPCAGKHRQARPANGAIRRRILDQETALTARSFPCATPERISASLRYHLAPPVALCKPGQAYSSPSTSLTVCTCRRRRTQNALLLRRLLLTLGSLALGDDLHLCRLSRRRHLFYHLLARARQTGHRLIRLVQYLHP